ncbi:major facilitator superfamily transporter [Actinomyces denticolens]|nr:major facilitator superfamily transporter [Actinomyces denticolens]
MLAGPISLRDYSTALLQRSRAATTAPAVGSGEDSALSSDQQAEVAAAVGIGVLLIIITVRRERRILAPARPPARTRPRRTAGIARPDRAPARQGDDAPEMTRTPEMARTPEQP